LCSPGWLYRWRCETAMAASNCCTLKESYDGMVGFCI
jgi:hypothetical protein